jgi:hypothetical protein
LESFDGYEGFNDFCRTFELFRGAAKSGDANELVGEFKGLFKVYPLPDSDDELLPERLMENFPSNNLEECLLRVYVIRGIDLQSKDPNGKSDPYIELELGKVRVDNRDEKVSNTTNPVFGKCVVRSSVRSLFMSCRRSCRMFELKATIPIAKDLIIRVKDWDLLTSDDTIGQTTIDLENRLLSKYRATCALPLQYNV